jgi:hypothetical protein
LARTIETFAASVTDERERQMDENCEGSTTISIFGATHDRDFASSSFDQLFGHPKANACSEIILCGEKWLEDLRQVLLPNSRANPQG